MRAPAATQLLLAVLDAPLVGEPPAFLGSLWPRAAWGAWDEPVEAGDIWDQGLCQDMERAGVEAGLLGLPLPRPLPRLPGWLAASLEGPEQARDFARPETLALDLADYAAGQLALLEGLPSLPHERDYLFAQYACLARLVFEQAQRLLLVHPPRLAGVGFSGLAWAAQAFGPEPARVALLWEQVDHYLGLLAQGLRPRAVLCLLGENRFLAWAPGRLPHGPWPQGRAPRPGQLVRELLDLAGWDSGA